MLRLQSFGLGSLELFSPPMPADLGYEGLLIEMDCPAWFGQSGSPIFQRTGAKSFTLDGVLAHTFEVLTDGSLDPEKIESDAMGRFVRRSMFSPIYLRDFEK